MLVHHGDRMFSHHGWWWGWGGILPSFLLLVLIGVTIWAVFRITARPVPAAGPGLSAPAGRRDQALEEVRLRYARGEMTREEFVQRSRDLGGPELDPGEPIPPPPG
jgi:uncharacterized membrane protein